MRKGGASIQGLAPFVLGVVGYATFDAGGGVIASLSAMGCVRSVVRVSTGIFTINLFPPQLYYTVGVTGADDAGGMVGGYFTSKALTTPSSCQIEITRCTNGAQVDQNGNQVTIFGLVPTI